MAVDVRYRTWMGYKQKVGDVYFFEIRIVLYIEVANYPLIQIGVARIPNDIETIFTLAKALKEIPLLIPELTVFPLLSGLDDWDCPEDLKLDYVSAPGYVSDTDYTALSVFPWTTPSFYMALCAYIPIADERTEIPSSVPDHDKQEVTDPDGTVFSPEKSGWWLADITIAAYTSGSGETRGWYDGAFVWDGIDIDSEIPPHLWYTYTDTDPFLTRPRVSRPLTWSINLAPAWTQGFFNHYESSGPNYWLEQDRWRVADENSPYWFYPEIEVDVGGGGQIPIVQGVSLLGLLGLPSAAAGGLDPMGGTDIFKFFKGG